MKFEVTILGCGSATPTLRHFPTSQVLNYNEQLYLFDCGEGAQLQMRRYKVRFQRINRIFITHLHGDHWLGLAGLLSTLHLLGRTQKLHIHAHSALRGIIESQLAVSHARLRFPIEWHALNFKDKEVVWESDQVQVESFPLAHGVLCCGFKFSEKPKPRNIRPEAIAHYNIPVVRIRQIKQGADYKTPQGDLIPNKDLTVDPPEPKSFAFCTDTAYHPRTAEYVKNVDLLYHEATFLEKDALRAKETKHSTARQAAQVALEAGARKLLLGHYSARYRDEDDFLSEAGLVFENAVCAQEGMTVPV